MPECSSGADGITLVQRRLLRKGVRRKTAKKIQQPVSLALICGVRKTLTMDINSPQYHNHKTLIVPIENAILHSPWHFLSRIPHITLWRSKWCHQSLCPVYLAVMKTSKHRIKYRHFTFQLQHTKNQLTFTSVIPVNNSEYLKAGQCLLSKWMQTKRRLYLACWLF